MTQFSNARPSSPGEIKWGRFQKFYALSAVYFGLASAVGAQPATTESEPASEQATPAPRQQHFQHPMLERPSSHEMQSEQNKNRIQRRGMQDTVTDGQMQRNIHPGAADANPPALDRSVRDQHMPSDKGASN